MQETPLSKRDGKAQVTFNPPKCTFCSQYYKTYDNMVNAADAAWIKDNHLFPSRSFSFNPDERFGKMNYSHPRLHPTRYQKRAGDVRLFIPATGCLPMGSFCGTHGYGLIHPNTINASVMQLSFASSHSDAPTHWSTQMDPHPQEVPDQIRAPFDMMSVAPNFDLQLEACSAEQTAKTIVMFDLGPVIKYDRSPIRTPGSTIDKKGSPEDVLKDVKVMLNAPRFGRWM